MQLLKMINPENVAEKDFSKWQCRRAVRAVVIDEEEKIGLLHVRKFDYYKLPGGGIEEKEDIEKALIRECKEELGVTVRIIKEIGSIAELRSQRKFHQISYCFLAQTDSKKGKPNFSDKEREYDYEIVWVSMGEAVTLLKPKKHTSKYYGRRFTEERDSYFFNIALKKEAYKKFNETPQAGQNHGYRQAIKRIS